MHFEPLPFPRPSATLARSGSRGRRGFPTRGAASFLGLLVALTALGMGHPARAVGWSPVPGSPNQGGCIPPRQPLDVFDWLPGEDAVAVVRTSAGEIVRLASIEIETVDTNGHSSLLALLRDELSGNLVPGSTMLEIERSERDGGSAFRFRQVSMSTRAKVPEEAAVTGQTPTPPSPWVEVAGVSVNGRIVNGGSYEVNWEVVRRVWIRWVAPDLSVGASDA